MGKLGMEDPSNASVAMREKPTVLSALRRPSRLAAYALFIGRNLLGWIFILCSWALGLLSPIPIGFLFFLIGFGLIWFPGKRRITARVLSGRPIPRSSGVFRFGMAVAAIILPTLLIVYLVNLFHLHYQLTAGAAFALVLIYVAATAVTLIFGLPMIELANRLLALTARTRRKSRPWLRRHGIELLPPRRRRRPATRGGPLSNESDQEIISVDLNNQKRAIRGIWTARGLWLRRLGSAAVTIAIFVWILKPVVRNWNGVRYYADQTNWARVFLASCLFAGFLFSFRVLSWRRILIGFGHRLPVAAAARIWSASELARYLPGVIWQVVSRAYLVRAYGVSAVICSTSQLLELAIFLLANVLLADVCLAWFGFKQMDEGARRWLMLVSLLAPLLLMLLHPRVFYGVTNRVLGWLKREPIEPRLRSRTLVALLGWAMLGLLWQSMAIWLITTGPLQLQFTKWWVVGGAYCLAWCAGFLAFWAPGGLGVRELVFVAAMQVALPNRVRHHFSDPKVLLGFLAFLSVLLRLWATAGELMLIGVSSLADRRALLGRKPR
jgi:hypothetical protein